MQIKTHIKEALDKAEVIIITAGAGMGVDSGLPDFRGKDGFWRAYPYL
ncbi:Sir2 family NAD-dependent protein deacetylase [Campylobacter coli]|nr:Sir2 family NAD-dependent protein deacetylase [Campylobacter coli]